MDYFWIAVAIFSIMVMLYGAIGLTYCMIQMKRVADVAEAMNEEPPQTPPTAKPQRLFRRNPEPDPGGTKVYPAGQWDEGLERDDV